MARLALTAGGYAVGFAIGGPLGGQIGGAIGGYLAGQLTAEDTEGPRLDQLGVAGGEEGAPIPQLYGTFRVTGHVIAAADLVEHETEEDAGGKGGPTHTTYSYTLTYAVAFCEPRLGAGEVRRVWANKKLVEDYRAEADGIVEGVAMAWYDGTQTSPDPELVSLIGEGNVPAYTGVCYGVYRDRDAGPFGNRPPIDEAEIVSNGSAPASGSLVDVFLDARRCYELSSFDYSPLTGKMYTLADDNSNVYIIEFNPFTRETTREILTTLPTTQPGISGCMIVSDDNTTKFPALFAVLNSDTVTFYQILNGMAVAGTTTFPSGIGTLFAESENWLLGGGASGSQWQLARKDGSATALLNASGSGISTSFEAGAHAIESGVLNQFLVMLDPGNEFGVVRVDADGTVTWVATDTNASFNTVTSGYEGSVEDKDGYYWFAVATSGGDALLKVNSSGSIQEQINVVADHSLPGFNSSSARILAYNADEHAIYWMGTSENVARWDIDQGTGEEFDFDPDNSLGSVTIGGPLIWHPETDRVIAHCGVGTQDESFGVLRLRTVAAGSLNLSDVIDDLCGQVGLGVSEYDTTNFTGTCVGYLNGRQGSAAGAVDQILRLGVGYMTSSDWALTFADLGAASVDAIDANDLGARAYGESPKPPIQTVELPSYRVPKRWQVRYAASDSAYEAGMVMLENPVGSNALVGTDQFPAAMTEQQAADLCLKRMLLHSDKKPYEFSLPRKYSHLDAGDAVTLPTNQGNKRVRITNIDRGHNGVLQVQAISDNDSDVSVVSQASAPIDSVTIESIGPSQLMYFDTPLLRDIDDETSPGPYIAAFVEGSSWPGVKIHSSSDGQSYTSLGGLDTEAIGCRCDTVPSAVDYEDYDTTNTLRVTVLTGGTLSSATDNAMLYSRANVALWGVPGRWEVVQFGTASLVSPGVYDLSRLLRGRRGTDPSMDSHVAGDWFVVVTSANMLREVLALADVDSTRYYKPVNYGTVAADAPVLSYDVGNYPLLPWTPNALSDSENVSGDIVVTWDWRTRKGGVYGGANSVTDGVPGVQQDETTGKFRVLDSVGNVLNTYNASTDSYTYTAANRATDYTGLSSYAVYYQVAQDASTVGITNGFWTTIQTYVLGFNVLDADANNFQVGRDVLDADGNSFGVDTDVLDADGNAFAVI